MMYGSRMTLDLLEKQDIDSLGDDTDMLAKIDGKMIELQKERQKFFDQRTAFSKAVRERAREEELNEILVKAIEKGGLPSLEYERRYIEPSDNDLLVSLNDIHYGAQHNNYWSRYDSDICREMFNTYLDKILAIAARHNSENCIVWANGDLISGSIHRSIQVTNKENVIEQITGVSELIAGFIAELSKHFANVSFVSVPGNHSRIDPNKDNALLRERLDDLVEWYLKARLQNFENVHIGDGTKIDTTVYVIDVRGKLYAGVHGDIDDSASRMQALQTMVGRPLYAILSGHMHHNKVDMVQGVLTIMAGSFIGMDDYCISKRIYGIPQQMVCVCDKDGVRCHYDITLA